MNAAEDGTEIEVSWDAKTAPILFCTQCNNVLYPEGCENRELRWRCELCKTAVANDKDALVYTHNFKVKNETVQENDLIAEFASDPTAQRDSKKKCASCEGRDVTCFVNPLGRPQEDMTLFFACANPDCRHVWKGKEVNS